LIKWLLENKPLLLWAFFFGLVIASIFIISKSISKWTIPVFLFIIIGTIISYYVTILEPTKSPDSFYYLFFCGFLAIIAMILPGISGAFILVLLGAYETAINTVNLFVESVVEMNFAKFSDAFLKIISLALGALVGLKIFSKILNWMFTHKKNITLAVLIGFMIGSLNKIWPWKKTITAYTNSHDVEVPLLQHSISPYKYEGDPQLMYTIIFALLGFLTIYLLEKLASRKQ
jgi:putative membrane protein